MNKLILGIFWATAAANAAYLSLQSDLLNEGNNRSGSNHAITVHPAWQQNGPVGGAMWISFRSDTGGTAPGHVEPNTGEPLLEVLPSATFWEEFTIHGSGSGHVMVWADDTARVRLWDGVNSITLFEANPVQDGACAAGPISCEPDEGALVEFALPSAGSYQLLFDVYQRGGGPFGLLYTGGVVYHRNGIEETPTPEPSTYLLMGAGLVAIGVFRRRRA